MTTKRLSFAMLVVVAAISASVVFSSCEPEDTDGGGKTTCETVLINGVRWTTCNIDKPGTFAAKPEDAGMFYQWNRKIGWSHIITKPGKASDGSYWNSSTPSGTEWEKANDPCPVGFRVPTLTEFEKLLDIEKVTHRWITVNDEPGYQFTDKMSGESIWLYAAGFRTNDDGTLSFRGGLGSYWSCTQSNSSNAYGLQFYEGYATITDNYERGDGLSIRCVAE